MSQTKYILSLDQGTTSSRAILFDNLHILCCGTLSKKEPSPWPVTVLSL